MKEIAGLLKGAEREECVLEKPSANRAGGGLQKAGSKDGKVFLLSCCLCKCARAGE